ncbi:NAD(P)H-hydrate epimerase [Smittium culicis]|uniref:NAD(P)H-hydrate epimerase n=1 Tax=Smittium culicis TaxID=133412 RepID=A0A1R1XQ23_9FUNG|nr:NAD(P)H-hydrate epimerase [Smittium culicis]
MYPKPPKSQVFRNLLQQCSQLDIPLVEIRDLEKCLKETNIVVDALFGFGFKPPVREPFVQILDLLAKTSIPIASIDVPSGWDVDNGNPTGDSINPDLLISLSVPKPCSTFFSGRYHYLGGRFIPKFLADEYNVEIPDYPGSDQCVLLPKL